MAYINTRTGSDPGSKSAQMFERAQAGYGYLPNMVKAFSHRPEVMEAWNVLLGSIKSGMDMRRYELVTMAAAKELRSSYCMLAHGSVLLHGHFTAPELQAVVEDAEGSLLDEKEAIALPIFQRPGFSGPSHSSQSNSSRASARTNAAAARRQRALPSRDGDILE